MLPALVNQTSIPEARFKSMGDNPQLGVGATTQRTSWQEGHASATHNCLMH